MPIHCILHAQRPHCDGCQIHSYALLQHRASPRLHKAHIIEKGVQLYAAWLLLIHAPQSQVVPLFRRKTEAREKRTEEVGRSAIKPDAMVLSTARIATRQHGQQCPGSAYYTTAHVTYFQSTLPEKRVYSVHYHTASNNPILLFHTTPYHIMPCLSWGNPESALEGDISSLQQRQPLLL